MRPDILLKAKGFDLEINLFYNSRSDASEITGYSTTGYAYNGQDQLAVVTDPSGDKTTYSFDGDGLRRSVATNDVNQDPPTLALTTMVWDGSDYLLLTGPTSDQVVLTLDSEIVACGSKDLLTDPLGSLVKEISAGASLGGLVEMFPYGQFVLGTGAATTPYVYVAAYGYYKDSADRDYVRPRELMKKLGRWMQSDPLWPNEARYRYAFGSPVQHGDPTGLQITGFLLPPNEILDVLPILWELCKAPFTYEYGNCCGLNKRCNASDATPGGRAKDCLDRACAIHDQCLATALEYFDPMRQFLCNKALCHAIKRCYRILCTPHRDRPQCNAAQTVGTFYCGLVGERFP